MGVRRQTGWFRRLVRIVTGWPRLFIAAVVAFVVIAGGYFLGARPVTAVLIGWNAGVVVFLVMLVELMATATPAEIRRQAARQDVGQFVVLTLSAVAAIASVVAIYAEVSAASGEAIATWRLVLGAVTIFLSWLFMHSMFAIHYAHEFYGPSREEPGGLLSPGEDRTPDYLDFFYFAVVIGMSTQVSDVSVTNQRVRKTVLAQGIVAFWFNVAVLALLINIAADAIRG
jgi:uncharacterized membrane protein